MVNSDIDIFCNYTLQFQRIRKINSYIKLFIEAAPSNWLVTILSYVICN